MNDHLQEDDPDSSPPLSEEEETDIRGAYPLMDAVARQEGWDDPEMDSYNRYGRTPHE